MLGQLPGFPFVINVFAVHSILTVETIRSSVKNWVIFLP